MVYTGNLKYERENMFRKSIISNIYQLCRFHTAGFFIMEIFNYFLKLNLTRIYRIYIRRMKTQRITNSIREKNLTCKYPFRIFLIYPTCKYLIFYIGCTCEIYQFVILSEIVIFFVVK